ncbi:MAG: hypothetical protein ACREEV_13890 [Dongiaceae bacterium]
MWPYTEAEQHWLGGGSGIAWPPEPQQITPQLAERLIADARKARAEELGRISRHVARKIADSADAVPEIIERHSLRRTYVLAERIADGLVRLVAMAGRWPHPRRSS